MLIEKMSLHAKSQLFYRLMMMLKVNTVYTQYTQGMQMAGLCYTQPFNNSVFPTCEYSFETNPSISYQ